MKGKVKSKVVCSKNRNEVENVIGRLQKSFDRDMRVSFAFLFGSYTKGEQRKHSDIDVAIYFTKPPKGIALLYFLNTLSEFIGKNADIIVLNTASAFLRHQVMKYGIPVVVKDSILFRQFRERTISDYDEYKFVSGMGVYD